VVIHPDEIDDRTVPIPAPHMTLVEIDDGGLLVDEEAGEGFALNATASLTWKLLDSVSPIGHLIDDLAATFGVARDEVADSVQGLVRFFGEFGMLDNVARSFSSLPMDIEYVDVDECGEVIPPETLPVFDARYVTAPPNA
jgi:hypothetical protein